MIITAISARAVPVRGNDIDTFAWLRECLVINPDNETHEWINA